MRKNRPESEISQRIEAVRTSKATSFRELLAAGGFDLKQDLRYQNLSGLSFAGEDLRGIDFTGANLIGCDFVNTLIEGARFERARLGIIGEGHADLTNFGHIRQLIEGTEFENARASRSGRDLPYVTNLKGARDWPEHKQRWTAVGVEAREREDHLPDWTVFMDAPVLPLMVVLPASFPFHGTSGTVRRVWSDGLTAAQIADFRSALQPEAEQPRSPFYRDSRAFLDWAKRVSGCHYQHLATEPEQLLTHKIISRHRTVFDIDMLTASRRAFDPDLAVGIRLVRELLTSTEGNSSARKEVS